MKSGIVGALGLLALASAGPAAAAEDRCADARRTCIAWCEENRGPDGTCEANCWKRYRACKRSGWFIWGGRLPEPGGGRCGITLPDRA